MPSERFRVLLAEDDPIGARFAIAALERLGHEVMWVETGRAALDRLKSEPFDVALLDVGLPELGGLDVARRYRNHERAHHGPTLTILVLSASDVDAATRTSAGIDEALEKPVGAAALGAALARHRPASVVDLAPLSERADHDEEFIRELLGDFLELSTRSLLEISEAVGACRLGDARDKAHRLRGALLAVGANRAAQAASRVELAAGDAAAEVSALAHLVHACETSVGEARAAIEAHLARR